MTAEMAFVYLDGLYLKVLREGEGVVREVVYVALGIGGSWATGSCRRRAPWGSRCSSSYPEPLQKAQKPVKPHP